MITCKTRPVIIIHSLTSEMVLNISEKKYLLENLEKQLGITMLSYNSNFSLHGVSTPYGISSITFNIEEVVADIVSVNI